MTWEGERYGPIDKGLNRAPVPNYLPIKISSETLIVICYAFPFSLYKT